MKPNGKIVFSDRTRVAPDGMVIRPMLWLGGKVAEVNYETARRAFHGSDPRPGMVGWIGPFYVRVLAAERYSMQGVIVTPVHGMRATQLLAFVYYLLRAWREFSWRLLATLALWEIAEHQWNRETTWADVRPIKALRAMLMRINDARADAERPN